MLRAYIWLAWSGIVEGRLSVPTMATPSRMTTRPGSVSSQLPPVSAARSTITEPVRIAETAPAVIRPAPAGPGSAPW